MIGNEIGGDMIEIKKMSDMNGAARFGACASCGKGTDETEITKIIMYNQDSNHNISVDLCDFCIGCLHEALSTKGCFLK